MTQSETCPKCGANECNEDLRNNSSVVLCAYCGYVFPSVLSEEQEEKELGVPLKESGKSSLLTSLYVVVFLLLLWNLLFGVQRVLVIAAYLLLAGADAFWARKGFANKAKWEFVFHGVLVVFWLFAAWAIWVGFRLLDF